MSHNGPFFTIITAVFNNASGFEQTLLSLREQSFKNFEYIVIDGGSHDNIQEVVKKHREHIAYFISEKDNGIYDAWNKAIRRSKGQWISFLGSGDIMYPRALEDYHQYIESNPGVTYVSSRVNLRKNGSVYRTVGQPWSWPEFLRYMTVAHVGSMHHKSLFERYGLFNDSYKITGDYEFLLRPAAKLKAGFVNSITVEMEVGGVSVSEKSFQETYRAKTETGKRHPWLAKLENWEAKCKYRIRSFLNK